MNSGITRIGDGIIGSVLPRTLLFPGLLVSIAFVVQNRPTIRVDVPLVMVDVQVSDVEGRPVTNLKQDDFQIFEDGKLRPIAAFEPVDSPYSIQLVLDRSSRMEIYWPLFEPALASFLARLKPQDRVSIGAFDERSKTVDLLLDWREARNPESLDIRVNPVILGVNSPPSAQFSGFAVARDPIAALKWAAQRLQAVSGHKGAIFFGDGRPLNGPERQIEFDGMRYHQLVDGKDDKEFSNLEQRILDSRARFDVIGVGTDLNPRDSFTRTGHAFDDPLIFAVSVRARLEHIAEISGGRAVFPRRVEDILPLYESIARELGTSYTLGFSPSAASREGISHRVEVHSRPGLKIQQSRQQFQ